MKNILYLLLAISLLASCKKEEPMPVSETYTGKLVADCNMVPMANSPIRVFIREPQSFGSNTIIKDFTTDDKGIISVGKSKVNHMQMRNCDQTEAAMRRIFNGDGSMDPFFKLESK